jgi:hypothetical protein
VLSSCKHAHRENVQLLPASISNWKNVQRLSPGGEDVSEVWLSLFMDVASTSASKETANELDEPSIRIWKKTRTDRTN